MGVSELFLLAQEAAEQYRGQCAPNPAVGAVLVSEGAVIGVGAHRGCGHPHAEVEALRQAGDRARGASLYVTLEPCCHHGRTPPCTAAIIEAGIQSVYYAHQDPNPIVAGQGAAQLRESGIVCEQVDVPSITQMYRAYTHWVRTKKPYVRAKLACSLDGKIAHAGGKPARISGEEAARQTAYDRLRADALLTSVRTVIADDPQLNSRLEKTVKKPVWVLDRALQMPPHARLWESSSELVLCHDQALDPKGFDKSVRLQAVALDGSGHLCWENILSAMGESGVHELWVEAGGIVTESLLQSGFLSELIMSVSPCVLGFDAVPGLVNANELLVRAKSMSWQVLGDTARCTIDLFSVQA